MWTRLFLWNLSLKPCNRSFCIPLKSNSNTLERRDPRWAQSLTTFSDRSQNKTYVDFFTKCVEHSGFNDCSFCIRSDSVQHQYQEIIEWSRMVLLLAIGLLRWADDCSRLRCLFVLLLSLLGRRCLLFKQS